MAFFSLSSPLAMRTVVYRVSLPLAPSLLAALVAAPSAFSSHDWLLRNVVSLFVLDWGSDEVHTLCSRRHCSTNCRFPLSSTFNHLSGPRCGCIAIHMARNTHTRCSLAPHPVATFCCMCCCHCNCRCACCSSMQTRMKPSCWLMLTRTGRSRLHIRRLLLPPCLSM